MLSNLAKNDIQSLIDNGHTPTFEEIIKLNDIANEIEHGKNLTVVNSPRVMLVGESTLLFEPTVGSDIWWHTIGKECTTDNNMLQWVYFYSLANARNVDKLNALEGSKQILKAVREWMKSLNATEGEIWSAVLYVRRYTDTAIDSSLQITDKEYIDNMFSYVIQCAGAMGVTPEQLNTVTRTQLVELLIQANIHAQIPMKKSVAQKYVEYMMMLKEIEGRNNHKQEMTDGQQP